ncbi:MAG: hypothetical protein DRI48_10350 [Chloroflexi bacterium]|mgnify:CR=1 FL=1|nr:MAG: hypothetical protein DRI48_10350 [Chloroflexota bacterium]
MKREYRKRKARRPRFEVKHYVMSVPALHDLVSVQETLGFSSASATVRFCITKVNELLAAAGDTGVIHIVKGDRTYTVSLRTKSL